MNDVQIIEVIVEDYRQYEGTESFELEVTEDQNINVIQGQNGSGKSNFLNAITLCFYDKEPHLDDSEKQGLDTDPYVNSTRLNKIDVGETASGSIEVKLGRDEPKYIFERTFTTAKLGEDEYESETGELQLHQRFGNEWKPVDQPNTRLSEILPTRVYEYFFFDGEKLDTFFEEGYMTKVKEAILDVSHIQLLERAEDHLDTVQSEFERKSANFDGNTQKKEKNYRDAKSDLEELNEEEERIKSNISDAEDKRDDIDSQLSDSRDEEVRDKQKRRKELNGNIEQFEEDIIEARTEAGEALTQAGILVYNYDALQFAEKQFEAMENDGELPPKIQSPFINELLERGECICGEDLTEAPDKRARLKKLQRDVPEISDDAIEGKFEVPNVLESVDKRVQELIEKKQNVEDTRDKIQEAKKEVQEISAFLEIKDLPDDIDVSRLEKQRKKLEKRIGDMQEKKGRTGSRIESQKKTVEKLREEWENEMNKKEKRKHLLRKIKFVKIAKKRVVNIKEEIMEQVRMQTEDCLEEYFNTLMWKNEDYDIELTDEYQVNITSPSGNKGLGTLSAGESQILALSFMSAMSQISGFSAPVIIDTPLGRISSEPKYRIAQNIPKYLNGKQVTFLMTDEEYTEKVSAFLKKSVANEYQLDYANEKTEVAPL
jgi:DNA sulfur modification protein DndD